MKQIYRTKKNSNVRCRLPPFSKLCRICVLGSRVLREGVGWSDALKNGTVDLQHGTDVEGSLNPCTKAHIPSKGFYNLKAFTFICYNCTI